MAAGPGGRQPPAWLALFLLRAPGDGVSAAPAIFNEVEQLLN